MSKVVGYINLTVRFEEAQGVWTAQCDELGTAAFGDDLKEAQEALQEAILMQLNALAQHGAIKQFFAEHGIVLHRGQPPANPRATEVSVRPGEVVSRRTEQLPMACAI